MHRRRAVDSTKASNIKEQRVARKQTRKAKKAKGQKRREGMRITPEEQEWNNNSMP